jgi:hypothetical protein
MTSRKSDPTSIGGGIQYVDRPDGMDAARYASASRWSPRRWAWEFLRRNEDFVNTSTTLIRTKAAPEDLALWAKEYGLVQFKHFNQPFRSANNPPPKFTTSFVGHKKRLTKEESSVYRRNLDVGDLVVRFTLQDCLNNSYALNAKIRRVKEIAEVAIQILREESGVKEEDYRNTKTSDWLKLLRLLDAVAAGVGNLEMASAIYPAETRGKTSPDELREFFKDRVRRARNHSSERYLFIATLGEKPEVRAGI